MTVRKRPARSRICVFQYALEDVGEILGCVGAFTPQDVIDAAKQMKRHADRSTKQWHAQQRGDEHPCDLSVGRKGFRAFTQRP